MDDFTAGYEAASGNRRMRIAESQNMLAWRQLADQHEEQTKRESDAGKAAEFFFKANPQALSELGLTDQAFANMSAREQSAAAMGYVQAQAQKEVYQKLAQQKADQAGLERFRSNLVNLATPVTLPALGPLDRPQTIGGGPIDGDTIAAVYLRSGAPLGQMDDIGRGYHSLAATRAPGFSPDQMGVARAIPGAPGRMFVPTTTASGQILELPGGDGAAEYGADDFKFDNAGNPTHWRVGGGQWAKWNPNFTLAPGVKKGTVRVITPPSDNIATALIQAIGGGQGRGSSPAAPAAPAEPGSKGKPTRALAKELVDKHGRTQAIEELRKQGYDVSGYAD